MEGERGQGIEEVFEAAVALDAEDRQAFLERACKGDDALLREMRRLLKNDSRAGDNFLAPPPPPGTHPANTLAADNSVIPAGTAVAGYTIRSLIAVGGMGSVYLAEQTNLRRNVALKVMYANAWSAAAERRFDVESQILAYLRHPNIAQIHEAGVQRLEGGSSLRYFAMEFVPEAQSIIRFANDRNLSLPKRLELFLQLCDAVQYGHQKSVIHRDLKPANILVDPERRVKVIDFGIARATDSDIVITTMHTEAGQLLGTLSYMSPEQCAADPSQIDTTTDVYSLGVILFELLTRRLPYDISNMTIQSAARVICEREPTRPSVFEQGVRGDLETIILKAIEKDRAKRYQSAADLASDIRRYLNREPIAAQPPTAWTRALRWTAKHPRTSISITGAAIGSIVLCATLLAVYVVNGRPNRIDLTRGGNTHDGPWELQVPTGDRATIYSLSNKALNSWTSQDANGIRLAKLVNRPSKWGGGKVAILGFAHSAMSQYRGQLCLFHAGGDDDQPIWHKTVDQHLLDSMPSDAWPRPSFDPSRRYDSDKFYVARAWLFDVFPDNESPGPEIVAHHQHADGSQGALRIYDLGGNTLFQAWQDGGVIEAHWMAKSGLLICGAIKADEDTHVKALKLVGQHPRVLFAIQPRLGDVSTKWINPYPPKDHPRFDNDTWRGEWYKPVWYKLPCPVEMADVGKVRFAFDELSAVIHGSESADRVRLRLEFEKIITSKGTPYVFTVLIDSNGDIQDPPRLDDPSREARQEDFNLPNPGEFRLLDWTEFAPPCGLRTTLSTKP